jgi:hypothetical protein
VQVNIRPGLATMVEGSQRMLYRTSRTGPWNTVPVTLVSGAVYQGALPQLICTAGVEFYFAVDTDQGTVTFPNAGCGDGPFFMRAQPNSTDIEIFMTEDFEMANPEWTQSVSPVAASGNWIRAIPIEVVANGTAITPSQDTTLTPPSGPPAVRCWVTDNGPVNEPVAAHDVDNGSVILTSPRFNLSEFTDAIVSYDRWFTSRLSGNVLDDDNNSFRVEASDDDGDTWSEVQFVGGNANRFNRPAWILNNEFTLRFAGVSPTPFNRLRFIVSDNGVDSLVEGAIDGLTIRGVSCPFPCDSIDFNNDGLFPDVEDINDFVSAFSGGPCSTGACNDIDFNNDGLFPDVEDVNDLLSSFAGSACP